MSAPVLHVVARIEARPGKEAETEAMLRGFVAPTLREDGCLRYELMQDPGSPRVFVFVEEWRDEAALDAHLDSPHIRAARERIPELLAGPPEVLRCRPLA